MDAIDVAGAALAWFDSMMWPLAFSGAAPLRIAASLALFATAAPAQAETFAINYSVRLLGLSVGTATLTGAMDPGGYKLAVTAQLTGVATVLSHARGAATATGVFVQGRVAPNTFATTSANDTMTRTIRIAMQAGNVKAAQISPPFDPWPDRIPILEQQKRNIIDPLSALIMPVASNDAVIGPAACARTLPVFDGWTRFDVPLSYAGRRDIEVKGYAGPVAVCTARYVPISGHRDRPVVKYMADNRDMDVWLAPIGATRVNAPMRMSVETMVGKVVIEATEFSLGGQKKAALR